jgi:hypothetical protein
VVDAFHFRNHSKDDVLCQQHCNPARYEHLRSAAGDGWQFNSSAAEQINAWFGGYQAIVKEMSASRFNFFLDEVIAIRNSFVEAELQRKGKNPSLVPEDHLRRRKSLSPLLDL